MNQKTGLVLGISSVDRETLVLPIVRVVDQMKRMGKILAGAVTAILLLMCLAIGPIWIRSHFAADYLSIPMGGGSRFQMGWSHGVCFAGRVEMPLGEPVINSYPPIDLKMVAGSDPQFHLIGNLGYVYDSERRMVFVPIWLMVILLGAVAGRIVYRRVRRREENAGSAGFLEN